MTLLRPRFQPHFHVEVYPPDRVYLLAEHRQFALTGRLYALLAPLLDGNRTAAQIADALAGECALAEVYYALLQLEHRGYTVDAPERMAPLVAAAWSAIGFDAHTTERQLSATSATVTAMGDLDPSPLLAALAAVGVAAVETGGLDLILTDDYLRPELSDWNQRALASGRPWMIVKPYGSIAWIGPVFRPTSTGCWECLAERLSHNRAQELALKGGDDRLPHHQWNDVARCASWPISWHLAALEVAREIARGTTGPREAAVLTLDLADTTTRSHVLVRRPQCRSCGDPGLVARSRESAPVLQTARRHVAADVGYRVCPPEETLERCGRHVSRITGVVSSLDPVGDDDSRLLHIYRADHARWRPRAGHLLSRSFRQSAAGKGTSDAQGRASALCEAVERWAGVYTGSEPCIRSSFADLGDEAIHPNACMCFSPAQYRDRARRNRYAEAFHWIPQPFDEARTVDWTPGWSVPDGRKKYLPLAYCYYGCPQPPDSVFCTADSNGCAAGNTLEEAILQGFLEVVERDAVALWWYNRVQRPAVDLDSFPAPYLHELRSYWADHRREIWALDLTADIEIPVFAVFVRRRETHPEWISLGFGAHLDPAVALMRAATEASQMAVIPVEARATANASELPRFGYATDLMQWLRTATLENQPYLAPTPGVLPRRLADYAPHRGEDLRDDVLTCMAVARRHGLTPYVLDQTRPDVPELRVVKVVVPDLRPFWARFAPGRLFDVPVALGWLPVPLAEDQLNPIPFFF